jgi:hypothetical protein
MGRAFCAKHRHAVIRVQSRHAVFGAQAMNSPMSAFWIFGITLNVALTALAIYGVVKQMRRRDDKRTSDR